MIKLNLPRILTLNTTAWPPTTLVDSYTVLSLKGQATALSEPPMISYNAESSFKGVVIDKPNRCFSTGVFTFSKASTAVKTDLSGSTVYAVDKLSRNLPFTTWVFVRTYKFGTSPPEPWAISMKGTAEPPYFGVSPPHQVASVSELSTIVSAASTFVLFLLSCLFYVLCGGVPLALFSFYVFVVRRERGFIGYFFFNGRVFSVVRPGGWRTSEGCFSYRLMRRSLGLSDGACALSFIDSITLASTCATCLGRSCGLYVGRGTLSSHVRAVFVSSFVNAYEVIGTIVCVSLGLVMYAMAVLRRVFVNVCPLGSLVWPTLRSIVGMAWLHFFSD